MNDEEAQLSNHRLPSPYTKRSRWQVGKLCTPTISCTLSPSNKEYAAASACSMNNLQKGVPCQSKQNPSTSPDSEHYGIGVSENSKTHLPIAARAAHGGGRGRSGNPAHRQYRKPHASLDPFHSAKFFRKPRCNLKHFPQKNAPLAAEFRIPHRK